MKKFVIALALLACIVSKAMSAPFATAAESDYRLPENAPKPKKYTIELTLKADAEGVLENSFDGNVEIELHDVQGTTFYLHRSNEMKIDQMTYCGQELNKTGSKVVATYSIETEIMKIVFEKCSDNSNTNKLTIKYKGVLYDTDMYGFYVSTFTTNDITYKFATTQFQGTFARRAFPCMDEPSFKATFDITIKHPDKYVAMSNQVEKPADAANPCTPAAEGNKEEDVPKLCTSFKLTPIMSTYLVAFIVYPKDAYVCKPVSPLESGKTNEIDSLKMDVCAPKHLTASATFAIEETRPIINHLNTITGISYNGACPASNSKSHMCDGDNTKMEQLNQIAIPDFAAGAMENWGLVTYRETALLHDSVESTWRDKQRIATVIAHEFAHMWFGNLVTLGWWSSTWLNEGFARYFEYHVINDLKADWRMADQFVIEQMHSIFQQDVTGALELTSEVYTQSGVKAKFGSITYNKGACIIRMLERALEGETCGGKTQCFLDGLNTYLTTKKFGNTEPKDLIDTFTTTVESTSSVLKGKINDFMKSWTEKAGYPVVHVSIADKKLVLKQNPFTYSKDDDSKNKWFIPITYYMEGGTGSTKPTHLMAESELKIDLADEDLEKFVIVNVGQTGYYRVHYEGELLTRLKAGLAKEDFGKISEINRAQIVDDAFNLARVGTVKYKDAFQIIDFLKNDNSYFSWYAAFNGFSYLRRRLPESPVKQSVTDMLSELMKKVYEEVKEFKDGESKTTQIEMYKKILVLQWACEIGHSTCRTDALKMFNENEGKAAKTEKAGATKTPANLRKVVYCEAARSKDNWDKVWKEYTTTTSAANKVTIITALGCVDDEETLNKYLNLSIDSTSGIRKQDAYSVFTAVLTGSPKGVDVCLDFLIKNHAKIEQQYASMNALSTVITSVADRLTTEEQAKRFNEFLDADIENLDDAKDIIPVAKATVKSNQDWLNTYKAELEETFNGDDDNGDGAASSIFSFSLTALLLVALSVNFLF